jgi:SAM-dependent methyltransferase
MMAFLGKFLKKREETPLPEADAPVEALVAPSVSPPVAKTEEGDELSRLELLQAMWTKGFGKPGSAMFVISMLQPVALDSSKTMLDLSAGLGGASRAVTDKFKNYVEGYERDPEIAAAGMDISSRTGFGKRSPITHYDPNTFTYSKRVDVVFAREFLYSVADKDKMIGNFTNWLKPRGHVVLIDFVCDEALLKNPTVRAWFEGEGHGAVPVSGPEMVILFGKHSFDLRINEDISAEYRQDVLRGFGRLTRFLEGRKLTRATKARVGALAEFWARRVAAIDAGVRVTRYYAIKSVGSVRAPV